MKDIRSPHWYKASNTKADGVTAGVKRDFMDFFMEVMADPSTDSAFFEAWLLLSSNENYDSCYLQLIRIQKWKENLLLKQAFAEPQSESSEHSGSGGMRRTVLLNISGVDLVYLIDLKNTWFEAYLQL